MNQVHQEMQGCNADIPGNFLHDGAMGGVFPMRFFLSGRRIGLAAILIIAAATVGANDIKRAAIRSIAPKTTMLPKGIPNPDFWWALPS